MKLIHWIALILLILLITMPYLLGLYDIYSLVALAVGIPLIGVLFDYYRKKKK